MLAGNVVAVSRRLSIVAVLAHALAGSQLHARPAAATTDECSLLKAGDVTALVGGTPKSKPSPQGTSCTWTGAKAGRKLLVLTYAMKSVPGEVAYMGARRQAEAGGDAKIADEAGMGERAFSGQVSFGVVFVALKHGQVLQLQYWTGGRGTSADVAALRPVMRKAVAAF